MGQKVNLYYYGDDSHLINFTRNTTFEQFVGWYLHQKMIGFDVETNVTDDLTKRKLILLQFSNLDGTETYELQFSYLTEEEKLQLFALLEITSIRLIIHNATFEYTTLQNYGCTIRSIYDTFLQEKILNKNGFENNGPFSLAATLERRYGIVLDKTCQTLFGDNIITDEKLIYGAKDVITSGRLHLDQDREIRLEGLRHVQWLENNAVCPFSDMMFDGMLLEQDRWRGNEALAEPIIAEAKESLKKTLTAEDLAPYTLSTSYWEDKEVSAFKKHSPVLAEDKLTVSWSSSAQKLQVLQLYFPDLEKCSAAELNKYIQEHDDGCPKTMTTAKGIVKPLSCNSKVVKEYIATDMSNNKFMILKLAARGAYEALGKTVVSHYKQKLIDMGLYLTKGTIMINWNSSQQAKAIFQLIDPEIENADADTVEAHLLEHDLFPAYKQYNNANSLITKFGESYITKNVDSDGRVRTTFDLIKRTGRVSSKGPNLQQIPKNALPPERKKDYRRCFLPTIPGWKIVATDYDSQELAVIATVCNEHVWIDALKTGKDLHSVCAEMIHKDKWKNLALDTCAFYKLNADGQPQKVKCKCPEHELLRQNTKKLDFGLAYGLSAVGYARDTGGTKEEGEYIMNEFFTSFTDIDRTLKSFAKFGSTYGYVTTMPPFRRKRWFPEFHVMQTAEPKYANILKGKIERASQNSPIQGRHNCPV